MDRLESLIMELRKERRGKNNPLYNKNKNTILEKIYKEFPILMEIYQELYLDKDFNNMIYSKIKGSSDLNESKSAIWELILLELPKFRTYLSWEDLLLVIKNKTDINRNKLFKYFNVLMTKRININSDFWEKIGYVWNIDDQWELESKEIIITYDKIKPYLRLLTEEQRDYIFNVLRGETLDVKSKEFLEIKKILRGT